MDKFVMIDGAGLNATHLVSLGRDKGTAELIAGKFAANQKAAGDIWDKLKSELEKK